MSTAIVKSEIERFLKSPTPEILCISGRWGVGKTFAWQRYLGEAEEVRQLAMSRYAYVSLFGLNSLSELRNVIVENTIIAEGTKSVPDARTLHSTLRLGEKFIRKSRPLVEIATGFFKIKDAGDALYRAAFLTVRKQLICFDDLERAGPSLTSNDVLGLVSMLREQRDCKIVLLLNKDAISEENKRKFEEQLEKVVDTFLVFEPTCEEALEICIDGIDAVSEELRERIKILNITNIRVIKKIERWARKVELVLTEFDTEIIKQAISTVVISGWAFLQPKDAPTLDFLRSGLSWFDSFIKKEISPEEQKWKNILQKYEYYNTDELDLEIINSISVGYFNEEHIKKHAKEIESRITIGRRNDSFSDAWRLYHDNLLMDDDEILVSLYNGALENLENILPVNINAAIILLRKYDHDVQASNLVREYIATHRSNPTFFSQLSPGMFFDGQPDIELQDAIAEEKERTVDARDPIERLKQIAENNSGFNPSEDVRLMSRITTDDWINLIYTPDKNLKTVLEWARRLAHQDIPDAAILRVNLDAALSTVAERSPMRRDRLLAWGVLSPQ